MDDEEFDEAPLEDGWELFDEGDLDGALAAAHALLETDEGSPDAHNLIGSVLMTRGEVDAALQEFGLAIEADPTYAEAMLNAADALARLGQPEDALRVAEEAAEFADDDEQRVDALLLQIDLLLAQGRRDAASVIGEDLPVGPFENPGMCFAVGRALFQLGELERAAALLEEANAVGDGDPDAAYYLGLVREARGDLKGATAAFLMCRDRDLMTPRPAWAEPIPLFEKRLRATIGRLPQDLSDLLDGALVLVDEVPGAEVVCEGVDPRAPLLMDDLDLRSEGGEETLRRVFVYQRNIERFVPGPSFVEEELRLLLEEEIPRAFGPARDAEGS